MYSQISSTFPLISLFASSQLRNTVLLLVRLPTALSCSINSGPEDAPSQSLMLVSFPWHKPWKSVSACRQEEGTHSEHASGRETSSVCPLGTFRTLYEVCLDFYLLISRAQVFHQGSRNWSRQLFDNGTRKKVDKTHDFVGDSSY